MEATKKEHVIIGVGNCGNQVAYLAEKKYDTLFDCVYINTSDGDLSMVKTANDKFKFKIGKEEEVQGSGKDRNKMKLYLKAQIDDLMNNTDLDEAVLGKKYGFIVVSTAGGTGSGAGPALYAVLKKVYPETHFILVMVLPQLASSLSEHGNSQELLKEVYQKLGNDLTYMVYDNETTSNLPITVNISTVNENIVEDLRVLTGVDNFPTPYESIDPADLDRIKHTPGRIIVARLTKNLTEKVMEDNNLDELIIKAIKKSCHAETDRNSRITRWGIITYFTEAVNKLYDSDLTKLVDFLGTPPERFNHNAVNDKHENLNFLYFIGAGLPPINDRIDRIKAEVDRLTEELESARKSDVRVESLESGKSYADLANETRAKNIAAQDQEVVPSDIVGDFL